MSEEQKAVNNVEDDLETEDEIFEAANEEKLDEPEEILKNWGEDEQVNLGNGNFNRFLIYFLYFQLETVD